MKGLTLAAALFAPLAAPAVVATTARTAPSLSGSAWSGVGQIGGASGVAVAPHLILTAAHVGAGNFTANGQSFAFAATELAPKVGRNAVDLRLVSVAETLPSWYALGASAKNGVAVTMVGYGGSGIVDAAGKGYALTGGNGLTVGTNVLSDKGTTSGRGPSIRAKLRRAGDAALTAGDSGGGWFVGDKLIGISDYVYSKSAKRPGYGFSKDGYFGSGAIDLTNKALRRWLDARIAADALIVSGDRAFAQGGAGQAVPEPTTFAALALGSLGLIRRRRRSFIRPFNDRSDPFVKWIGIVCQRINVPGR